MSGARNYRTNSVNHSKIMYQCSNCKKYYSSEQSLRIHTERCIDHIFYVCLICKPIKTFSSYAGVLRHFDSHPYIIERREFYGKCQKVNGKLIRTIDGLHIQADTFKFKRNEARKLIAQRKNKQKNDADNVTKKPMMPDVTNGVDSDPHDSPVKLERSDSSESVTYIPSSEEEATSTTQNHNQMDPINTNTLLQEFVQRSQIQAGQAEASSQSNIRRYFDAFATDVEDLPADLQMKCKRAIKLAVTNIINRYQEMAEEHPGQNNNN